MTDPTRPFMSSDTEILGTTVRSRLGGARTKALVMRLDFPALLATIRGRLQADIEVYQRCSPEVMDALVDAIARNLAVASQSLLEDAPVDEGELQPLWESAKHRYDEGFGVDDLLLAYGTGIQEVWRALVAAGEPGDEMALADLADFMYGYGTRITAGIAGAFFEVRERAAGERERLLRRLFDSLAGNDPLGDDELSFARVHRFAVGPALIPFAISVPEPRGGEHSLLAAQLQGRAIIALSEGRRVMGLAPVDGLLLDPLPDDAIVVTGPSCERAEIGDVLGDLRLAIETARKLRRPGRHSIASFSAELLLAQQPRIAQELVREVIGPLEATARRANSADLAATLAAYFDAGLDRGIAATALFVHPNTLDRRLQRITAITGMSFNNVADITRLQLAIVARQLAGP